MEKYDLSRYKYFGMAILICLIFFGAVIKAYQYIPNTPQHKTEQISEMNTSDEKSDDVTKDEETNSEKTNAEEEKSSKTQESEISDNEDKTEEINSENSKEDVAVDEIEKTFNEKYKKAETYVNEKKYVEAINVYKEIITLASDDVNKALGFEKIALIYASQKQYTSAMKYAQKSYTLNPTTNTELFIARLYYKTGEIDKATQRVNHLLKQDF